MSVQINLPNLAKGIKVPKDIAFDNPTGYVCVVGGHAIICNSFAVVVFDLRDYFTTESEIIQDELQYFEELMKWMENKNFTPEFWKELCQSKTISVINDERVHVESDMHSKDLIYIHRNVLIESVLKLLNANIKRAAKQYSSVAYSNRGIEFIQKTVGHYIGSKSIIFEFIEKEKPARFTIADKFYIFGVINPYHVATEAIFNFESFHHFCEENKVE